MTESSLPPLTISQKEISFSSQEHDLNLPALETNEEEIMQAHLLRVQEAIVSSADAKVHEIQIKLVENQLLLKRTNDEKANCGVALYRANKGVGQLNKALHKTRRELERTEEVQVVLEQDYNSLERAMEETSKEKNDIQLALKELKKKYDDSQTKIQQLIDINTNYTSEVKIQKRINSKLKKEMEIVTNKTQSFEAALQSEKEKNEMLHNARVGIEGTLAQQQSEVTTSQIAINILHKEINDLTKVKALTEKQWEEAMTAMSNRDKTIQVMSNRNENIDSQLLALTNINSSLNKERDEIFKNLTLREQELGELKQKYLNLQNEYQSEKDKLNHSTHALTQAHNVEESYKTELKSLKKQSDVLSRPHVRINNPGWKKRNENIASLKSKITSLKDEFEETLRFHVPVEKAFKREEAIQVETQKEIRSVRREEDAKNIELRKENANLKINIQNQDQELTQLRSSFESLREQHVEINGHYSKLYEEAKKMIYTLERKEHDLNLLRAKSQEQEDGIINQLIVDHKDTFNLIISGLRSEVLNLKTEKDRLQFLWLESQKELVGEQTRFKSLNEENDMLKTRLGISDGVKLKMDAGLNEVKNESFEHKLEAAKLYNELKKIQPIIAELQDRNKKLEHQLHESVLKLDEAHLNSTTTKHMLRTEIRRLGNDRSILRHEKAEHDKTLLNVEKNTQLYKEMIDKLKSERYALQREVFSLKRRADESERKFFDAKLKERQRMKIEAKRKSNELNKMTQNIVQQTMKKLPFPVDGQQHSKQLETNNNPKNTIQDLPDFDSWRLKIESLTTEKDFLVNENKLLKKKVNEFTERFNQLQNSLKESQDQNKLLNGNEELLMEKLEILDSRYARAKNVAAHIEKQMKDAKPNAKIDYQLLEEPEPSTQLLAAILAKDSVKRQMSSR